MRFCMLQPWPIGQFCIGPGTVINGDRADESQMTFGERLCEGRVPPLNAVLALDYDCAWVMHQAYPEFRHRLQRKLGPFGEEMFEKLARGELHLLTREEVREARDPALETKKAKLAAMQEALAARRRARAGLESKS